MDFVVTCVVHIFNSFESEKPLYGGLLTLVLIFQGEVELLLDHLHPLIQDLKWIT